MKVLVDHGQYTIDVSVSEIEQGCLLFFPAESRVHDS